MAAVGVTGLGANRGLVMIGKVLFALVPLIAFASGDKRFRGNGRNSIILPFTQNGAFYSSPERGYSLDTLAEDPVSLLASSIPGDGVPGEDYPILSSIPDTGFDCSDYDFPGYFADTAQEAGCQVFHICQQDGRLDSFLCPNGTIFNQRYFVCDWWFNVDCAASEMFTNLNAEIGKVGALSASSYNMEYPGMPGSGKQRPVNDRYMSKSPRKLKGMRKQGFHSQQRRKPAPISAQKYGKPAKSSLNSALDGLSQIYGPPVTPAQNYESPTALFERDQSPQNSGLEQNYGSPTVPAQNYGPPTSPSENYGPPQSSSPAQNYGPPTAPAQNYGPRTAPPQNYGPPTAPTQNYGPPTAPAQNYGPPTAPAQNYGPPTAPAQNYGPPTAPAQNYGPPIAPAQNYGPPTAPAQNYGPPTAPAQNYGPPTAPAQNYGPPTAPVQNYGAPQNSAPSRYY